MATSILETIQRLFVANICTRHFSARFCFKNNKFKGLLEKMVNISALWVHAAGLQPRHVFANAIETIRAHCSN